MSSKLRYEITKRDNNPREGWEKEAITAHQLDDDILIMDFLNEFDKKEWTW